MILSYCEPQHMHEVKVPDVDDAERHQALDMILIQPHIEEILTYYGRSLIHENRVMACFGIWPMWSGVGRAWSLISIEAGQRFPKTLYKCVLQGLRSAEKTDNLHRIEATVRFGHPTAHSWIRHLGFKREGLMKNYGMGGIGDSHLYARTRAWAPL